MRTNFRFSAALGALLCAMGVQGATAAPMGAGDAAAIAQICRHYDNRARFVPREGAVAPVARLADACAAAARALDAGDAEAARREAARDFLDRLRRVRAQIDAINADRTRMAFAARQERVGVHQPVLLNLSEMAGLVTPTGEYLIFRISGVFDALDAWVEAGGGGAPDMAMR